jgi:hypothetical protein
MSAVSSLSPPPPRPHTPHSARRLRQRTADMIDQKIANVALYDVSTAQTVQGARA